MKWLAFVWMSTVLAQADPDQCFTITVVDAATGRGVPLVELRTTNEIRLWTDSAGVVAFTEPGLMGKRVFFHVSSHGYEHAADGFGYRGVALDVQAGGAATVKVQRHNLAERLCRLTGAGIYRDSVLAGRKPPLREPLLAAQVAGQDSVQAVVHDGRIFWFWGDTSRPAYPLGHFGTSGAVSALPDHGGLRPSVGVDYTYFTGSDGFARPVVPGEHLRWIDGVVAVADPDGKERIVARLDVRKSLGEGLSRHFVVWDDAAAQFERLRDFAPDEARLLQGHALRHDGWFYFCNPFPIVRVRADWTSLQDPARYEGWTLDGGAAWRPGVVSTTQDEQERAIAAGTLQAADAWFALRDAASGAVVRAHGGSIAWNAHRQRWILLATERGGGPSMLGEVWFAEAPAIEGPWRRAHKVVTHDRYSFYNVVHHPFFDEDGGRTIYFEGTYTGMFSRQGDLTPRYEYNQILYRLDLADPRLSPSKP
jgi:hypothetical protein